VFASALQIISLIRMNNYVEKFAEKISIQESLIRNVLTVLRSFQIHLNAHSEKMKNSRSKNVSKDTPHLTSICANSVIMTNLSQTANAYHARTNLGISVLPVIKLAA